MAALPEEVSQRLAVWGSVRLAVGEEQPAVGVVAIAPLSRQIFLLVPRGGALDRRLLDTTRASFTAEDPEGEYFVSVTGRAVVGRPMNAEPRRPELMHWLPEVGAPANLCAVRFHPETLEYLTGSGSARTRAFGPVPGGAAPPRGARWWRLASEGVVAWMFVCGVLDWAGLLYFLDEERRRMLVLVLMVAAGLALLCGVVLADQAARLLRWRESLESDASAALMLEAWEPVQRVRGVAFGMMLLGAVLAVLLGTGAGWQVGAWTVFTSGAPFYACFYGLRHLLRRGDAAQENG